MDYYKEIITSTIERLLWIEGLRLDKMKNEYKRHRTGRLIIRNSRGRLTYSEKFTDKEKGITGDKERIQLVIQNARLKNLIETSSEIITILEELLLKLNSVKEKELLHSLLSEQQIRANYSPESWAWMKASYDTNPAFLDDLQFTTLSGTVVRTKSEWRIASTLEEAGIPYRYEQKMYIDGNIMYPDFTILRADGSTVIWEHCGLMDDQDYAAKTKRRIARYEKAGFRQHTDLICTYEEDIKSQEDINNIIKRFILI